MTLYNRHCALFIVIAPFFIVIESPFTYCHSEPFTSVILTLNEMKGKNLTAQGKLRRGNPRETKF